MAMSGKKSRPVLTRRLTGRNFVASLLVLLSAIWCAPSYAVVGGERMRMSYNLTRYVVGIRYDDEQGKPKICTGGVIGTHLVLTAAHCVPKNLSSMKIVIGDTLDMARAVAVLGVTAARVHKDYEKSEQAREFYNGYDLAVVRTKDPLPAITRHLQLAAAYFPYTHIPTVYIIGYGMTDKFGKRVNEEVLNSAIARRPDDHIDERLIEIDQTKGTGVCKGDSGGPMVVENDHGFIVMGVSSTVFNAEERGALCSGVGTFISVSHYRHWIMKQSFELMQVYR